MKWKYLAIILIWGGIMINAVNAQILDENTEVNCNKGLCNWTQTMGKRFHEYNGSYTYFNEYINSVSLSNVIGQISLSGTQVNLIPILNHNSQNVELSDISPIVGTQLDYNTFVDIQRDGSKFTIEFNMVEGLNKIGFRVESNKPIRYIDYNYTPEGIYEVSNAISLNPFEPVEPIESIPIYEVTDLVIGELRYSFVDLIENGFNISYDKRRDILWIDLQGMEGHIVADPTYSFYSDNTDACLEWGGGICSATNPVYDTTSTLRITDDHTFAFPADMSQQAYFMFNTSTLPDDAILTIASLKHYVSGYFASRGYRLTWNIHYYSNQSYFGDLDCGDKATDYEGTSNWGGTIGAKTLWMNVSRINKTGYTNYRLLDGWTPVTPQWAYVQVRTSEYAGTIYDPQLLILYELPIEEEPLKKKKQVYPYILLLIMLFTVLNMKNGERKSVQNLGQ